MLTLHSFRSVLRLFWIVTVYYFQKKSVCSLVSGRRVDGGGGRCWCKINLASFLFHFGRLRQFSVFFFFKSNLYMTVISSVRQKTAITFFAQKGWIKLFWGTLIRIRCFSSETLHLLLKLWAYNVIFKLQLFFLSSDYKLWLISNSQAFCKLIYSDYPFLTSFPFKIRIIRVNPVSWLK